jgi:hypothetical protein
MAAIRSSPIRNGAARNSKLADFILSVAVFPAAKKGR